MIEIIKNKDNKTFIGYKGDYIFEKIKNNQTHDPIVADVLKEHLTKDSVCIDIGAYIGDQSVYLSSFCKKVYSFEPQHDIFLALCANLFLNQALNVFPYERIAYYKNDRFSYASLDTTGNLAATAFIQDNQGPIIAVRVDEIVTEKVDFIKCDAQGGDLDALMGCQKIIDKFKPKILFERETFMMKEFYNRNWQNYINFFNANNYKIKEIVESNFIAEPI